MNYIDDDIATFRKYAEAIFQENVTSFKDKEEGYLKGTNFLRLRVLNNLVDLMRQQLHEKISFMVTETRKKSTADAAILKTELDKIYETYISRFRNQHFNTE